MLIPYPSLRGYAALQGFQRLPGMSDASSLAVAADLANSGVTSFAQQSFAPDQAPQLSKDLGPAVAVQPEGYAPGFPPSQSWHFMEIKHFLLSHPMP